jgi:hypothetical protein
MRFLDRLLGRTNPDDLRERLFDAAKDADNDAAPLYALCRANERAIIEAFPSWRTVPKEVRDDREKCCRWGNGLIMIARVFAELMGRPELLASSIDPPGPNSIFTRLERELSATRDHVDAGRWDEAFAGLSVVLSQVEALRGSGADHYRAIALGQLGEARHHVGDLDGAREAFEGALAACEHARDEEGIRCYRRNLALTRKELER